MRIPGTGSGSLFARPPSPSRHARDAEAAGSGAAAASDGAPGCVALLPTAFGGPTAYHVRGMASIPRRLRASLAGLSRHRGRAQALLLRRPRSRAAATSVACLLLLFGASWSWLAAERRSAEAAAEDFLLRRSAWAAESAMSSATAEGQEANSALVRDGRRCADAIGAPAIALMYLTTGAIPHDALWGSWFERAAGVVPRGALEAACGARGPIDQVLQEVGAFPRGATADAAGDPRGRRLRDTGKVEGGRPSLQAAAAAAAASAAGAAGAAGTAGTVGPGNSSAAGVGALEACAVWSRAAKVAHEVPALDRQILFDVLIHPRPEFTGHGRESTFWGRELPASSRVATRWGTHSLVDAHKALLRAALSNPRTVKFVLVSDTSVPIYGPLVAHDSLSGETLSRINACVRRGWYTHVDQRWVPGMGGPGAGVEAFRKSWQWSALTRKHARVVLADSALDERFRRYCRIAYEPKWKRDRVCYSDEHYVPTLLAALGLERETDCAGEVTDADWDRRSDSRSPHPYRYDPDDITPSLFARLQRWRRPGCGVGAARAADLARARYAALDEDAPAHSLCDPSWPLAVRAGFAAARRRGLLDLWPAESRVDPSDDPSTSDPQEDGSPPFPPRSRGPLYVHEHPVFGDGDPASDPFVRAGRAASSDPATATDGAPGPVVPRASYSPYLSSQCPLFARKFDAETVKPVLAAFLPCQSPVRVLNDAPALCGTGAGAASARLMQAARALRNIALVLSPALALALTLGLASDVFHFARRGREA